MKANNEIEIFPGIKGTQVSAVEAIIRGGLNEVFKQIFN